MKEYIDITYIIVAFVCGLVPTLLTLWLNEKVKGSVKNSFDKKLEDVKAEHSKEISQFQIELNHLKSKDNFKFTKLHEKRFEVLERTYMYINETSESLKKYISPIDYVLKGSRDTQIVEILKNDYANLHDEFQNFFNKNRIFFDEPNQNLLDEFFSQSLIIFATYNVDDIKDNNMSSIKELNVKLYPIKKQIEIKFRELLGE
jgi:hypothetical protein